MFLMYLRRAVIFSTLPIMLEVVKLHVSVSQFCKLYATQAIVTEFISCSSWTFVGKSHTWFRAYCTCDPRDCKRSNYRGGCRPLGLSRIEPPVMLIF
jgi:hypothetical protein